MALYTGDDVVSDPALEGEGLRLSGAENEGGEAGFGDRCHGLLPTGGMN